MHTADVARGAAVLLLNVKKDVIAVRFGIWRDHIKEKVASLAVRSY
jgi:hypothetical protein